MNDGLKEKLHGQGALVGSTILRHKTAKASFQRGFWITVVVNLVLFGMLWRSGVAAIWTAWLMG